MAQTVIPGLDNSNKYIESQNDIPQPITARQFQPEANSERGFSKNHHIPLQQLHSEIIHDKQGLQDTATVGLGMSPGAFNQTILDTVEDEFDEGIDNQNERMTPNLYGGFSPDSFKKISQSERKAKLQFKDTIDVNNIQSSGESSPESHGQIYSPNQQMTAVAQSPALDMKSQLRFLPDEAQMHKDAYEKVSKFLPPNPILPKSFLVYDDSPRSGGEQAYIKLLKFRGKDFGRSKFEIEKGVHQIEFPEGVSLKNVFAPLPDATDDKKTAFGEIVYQRHPLDFSNKNHQAGSKKDEVVEENLLDVRRILKNSQAAAGGANLTGGGPGQAQQKKGLVNLQGVDTFYKKKDSSDKTLIFESRFESGNLAAAVKVTENEYHLLLQNDVNTSGHTQWFFYRVQNTRKFTSVRFNMLNLSKPDSLFNEGMKVLVYSEKHSEEKDIGWHRTCSKIAYYHNGIKKDNVKKKAAPVSGETSISKSLYTLTFTYDFQYDDDTVYFAYCYPYNYTDMLDDLTKISSDPIKSSFCARKTLCLSLAGNKVEMLTITSKNNLENLPKRKGVFITARVHPGESVGSWMMKGVIDYLTDENNEEAETLRQNFVFKIIPMLNPDGVINGNYRCSLAGCDLNRRWKAPSKVLHPCIYFTKQLLQQFSKERELVVFCDFHGHSRRKSIFMYGCQNEQNPEETRLYPFLMSKICPFFSFNYSRFGNQKSKEATARIAMFNEIKISAIYTMESSFCGMDEGPFANYHFSTENLMQTGRDFCRTLLLFCNIPLEQRYTLIMLQQIKNLVEYKRQMLEKENPSFRDAEIDAMVLFFDKIKLYQGDKKDVTTKRIRKGLLQVLRTAHDVGKDGETSSSAGSDKAPSEDNLEPEDIQMVVPAANEDENAKAKKKKKDQPQQQVLVPPQDTSTSISPQRRQNKEQLRRLSTLTKTKPIAKVLKKESSKQNLKTLEEEKKEEVPEEEPKLTDDVGTSNAGTEVIDDTVTHKKKRKRNVESRDVWTQTDRSDYMLIKYRQKQKMALQMSKGQKLTKEEQQMYEQALAYHKQQQAQNKTIDPTQASTPPLVNQNSAKQNGVTLSANRAMQGGNATMYSNIGQIRDKNDSNMASNSGDIVSRNLNSAQSNNTKNNQRKKIVVSSGQNSGANMAQSMNPNSGQGRTSQMIFQQNGQLYQLVNNQAVPIKTHQLNEVQLRHLQSVIDHQAYENNAQQAQQPPGNTLPLISGSSGSKRKSHAGANLSAPPGVGVSQKFASPQKKGTFQEINQHLLIPQNYQQPTFSLANQVLVNGGPGLLLADMTSSHSSQRIANARLPNNNTEPQSNGSFLMVMPQHQVTASQRSSQGAILKKAGQKGEAAESTPPVLENAYIQKKLMQQQQMDVSGLNEYVGIKPIGGATFFGGGSSAQQQALEYHQGAGQLSRRKIGLTGVVTQSGHATNNDFYSVSNNNALLKKMIENQWQQAVAISQNLNNAGTTQPNLVGLGPQLNQSMQGSGISNSQLFVGNFNPNNGQASFQNRTGRKNVSQKNPQSQFILQNGHQVPLFANNQGRQSVQHSTNIISGNHQPQLGMLQGSPIKMLMNQQQQQQLQQQVQQQQQQSPVKINIVNVHNQFNIHNNIIINNSQPNGFVGGSNNAPSMPAAGGGGMHNFFPAQQMTKAGSGNSSSSVPINIIQAPLGNKQGENNIAFTSPLKKK